MKSDEDIAQDLLRQGILDHKQLTEALEFQRRLPKSQMMTLPEVLVACEYLTAREIEIFWNPPGTVPHLPDPEHRKMLGEIMLENAWLEEWQLVHALCSQKEPDFIGQPLGEVLVGLGYTSRERLSTALSLQLHPHPSNTPQWPAPPQGVPRLGEMLIQAHVLEEWQLRHALKLQQDPHYQRKGLGTLLVELGYISREFVAQALALQQKKRALHQP